MAEDVTVWTAFFVWEGKPKPHLSVHSYQGSRTAKQVRISQGGGYYSILDPGTCHFSEEAAVMDCLERAEQAVVDARNAVLDAQDQLDEVRAYVVRRKNQRWAPKRRKR